MTLVVIAAALAFAVSAMASGALGTPDDPTSEPAGYQAPANDGLGVQPGTIKHVWLIVLENRAYDASFTGLSANSYLWQQLPQYGALLTNYYGTGHSSLDNYLSLASGQAPVTDDQSDCPVYTNMAGNVDLSGTLKTNENYGQFASGAGPNAPSGDNGCVYPSTVPTLFDQLDKANVSWKVYAQDLGNADASGATHDAGTQYCGAPDTTPGPTPSTSSVATSTQYPNPSSANSTDQYVAKHNPLAWFSSVLDSGDCSEGIASNGVDGTHLAALFGSNDQLYNDLQSKTTTPALSVIIPNNCSNAHDPVCKGNNLSGGFTGQVPNSPKNNVGGLYAADLFLQHVIPEIMESPAYSDGGMIDVTFDEAYPPFTYSNDSIADSTLQAPTAGGSLTNDAAGETLFGRSLNWEPAGPNVPITKDAFGQSTSAGPGYSEYLDRPGASAAAPLVACTNGSNNGNGYYTLPSTTPTCLLGGGGEDGQTGGFAESLPVSSATVAIGSNGAGTQSATSPNGLLGPEQEGETVTFNGTAPTLTDSVTDSTVTTAYLGSVGTTAPAAIGATGTDTTSTDQAPGATFQLVDAAGNPVNLSAPYSGTIALSGETPETDPLYDAFDATEGGGDTGDIVLSPYIAGGTVSNTYYNHYSTLRTLEDILLPLGNDQGSDSGYTGSINLLTGLDGDGHIGYAAQPGLAPFGQDVFTAAPGSNFTYTLTNTVTNTSTVTNTDTVTTTDCVVPDVKGDTLSEAKAVIDASQCKVGRVSGPSSGVVSSQSLASGKKVKTGTVIDLTLKK